MDFARAHKNEESVTTRSKIKFVLPSNVEEGTLDHMLVTAANQAAVDLFLEPGGDAASVDASRYHERLTPQTETIQPNQLVVIFESFDNLKFCYAKPGDLFSNRNGNFHHDDFIGKPYGCKIRSRNNRGYGFVRLLKPTPELWARSLNHRTQIVHELDASMIVFFLNLRPNMVVCESGTGSGALSHCILRTIAPHGHLYTYEFNKVRAETARHEFKKNRVDGLVTVRHRDVCGKQGAGGFRLGQAMVDAVVLDLPQPWLAVPHAGHTLKPNGRIVSYSPCVEQSQKTISALKQAGFHSVQTKEFRLKEHYVDEVEYEGAPQQHRPRIIPNPLGQPLDDSKVPASGGEDTGPEAENERSEYETEGDQTNLIPPGLQQNSGGKSDAIVPPEAIETLPPPKRRKVLVTRPFVTMRGHTAFLTFATAGNLSKPDPNVI